MKLRYHQATISFCPDLLNPDGVAPIPVGVLLLAEAEDIAAALLTVDSHPALPESLPLVVREIAKDFPRLVSAQLEQILHSDASASIDTMMQMFEDSLRNSFYVSDLKLNQKIEVQSPKTRQAAGDHWLYEPTTRLANATIARTFFKPPWMQTTSHYRPWRLDHSDGSGGRATR